MKAITWIVVAAVLFALGTAVLGWWAVPLVAAIWGLASPSRGVWWRAFLAGSASWGLLLAGVVDHGPAGDLADRLGQIFGTSGAVIFLATLILPGLAAATAAELAASMRRLARG